MRRSAVFGLVAAVAICTAAASSFAAVRVALATIPDANNVIHACYVAASGEVRLIDSPTTSCRPSETALSWGQSGISGYEVVQETRTAETGAFTGWHRKAGRDEGLGRRCRAVARCGPPTWVKRGATR